MISPVVVSNPTSSWFKVKNIFDVLIKISVDTREMNIDNCSSRNGRIGELMVDRIVEMVCIHSILVSFNLLIQEYAR